MLMPMWMVTFLVSLVLAFVYFHAVQQRKHLWEHLQ